MTPGARADQLWQPTTFLERGVAMPFTTPALSGTRARPALGGLEMIIPHPAGARGVYILAWSALADFCTPTLHDTMLSARLAAEKTVTPRQIRACARAVAAEGAAGRGACAASHAAAQADRQDQLLTNFLLLQRLVEQTTGHPCPPAELDRQAKAAILRLAGQTGRPAEMITNDIEALSALYASLGAGGGRARCVRMVDSIQRTMVELKPFGDSHPGKTSIAAAMVITAAEVTLALARRTLADAQARLADLPALLAGWAADTTGVAALLARPEWLLDGWDQICLIWHLAEDGNRRAAAAKMAMMVPVIPREAGEWLNLTLSDGEAQRLRRLVQSFEDWRTGNLVFDLIGRNEQIRTLAA
jgi:hypothetical protein